MKIPKDKKPGQQYTRKELLARGWTNEMVKRLLSVQSRKGRRYYPAASVLRTERLPEVRAELIQNRRLIDEKNRIRGISDPAREACARAVAKALEDAFAGIKCGPEVHAVASAWHEAFLDLVRHPMQQKESVLIYTKEDILRYFADHEDKMSRGTFFKKLVRSVWILGEDSDFSEFPKLCSDRILMEAERDYQNLMAKAPKAAVKELLSLPNVKKDYPQEHDLYYCYLTYFVPSSISRDLREILAVEPKDEYPAARLMDRRFVIHVGGTNTGKTYQSLQWLKAAVTGVYLAPLRLLALEVQETLLEQGVICSLLTGEEEDIRPGGTHISSTVEKLDISQQYDVAVIDECQMISDEQRGFAWTRAILGIQSPEIHLCVAPEGLRILKALLEDTAEPYEVITHERKVPLNWESKPVFLNQARKGDAFVAFSKKTVLQIAEQLRKSNQPASIIYGALPYVTRRRQMQRFLDGETAVVVATDAIGMGLNLPIRRVIFMDNEKYDGFERRPLHPSEVRQIAGRAGRFGIYDQGFAAAFPGCEDLEYKFYTTPPNVKRAALGFSDLVLKLDFPLSDVLRAWNQMPVKAPYARMDISRYIYIIRVIQDELHLDYSKEDLLRAGNIPFDEQDEALMSLFSAYANAYAAGDAEVERPKLRGKRLNDLETYYKMLDLYYSFSKNFNLDYDQEWLADEKLMAAEAINHLLINDLYELGWSCRKCGGPLALDSPYGLCRNCYMEERRHRRQTAGRET